MKHYFSVYVEVHSKSRKQDYIEREDISLSKKYSLSSAPLWIYKLPGFNFRPYESCTQKRIVRWIVDPFSEGWKPASFVQEFVQVSEHQLLTKIVTGKRQLLFFILLLIYFSFAFIPEINLNSGTAANSPFSMNCVVLPIEKCPWLHESMSCTLCAFLRSIPLSLWTLYVYGNNEERIWEKHVFS